jgi:hypothetical protein
MAFNLKRWLAGLAASAGTALLTFVLATAPAWGQGVATGGGGGGGGAVSGGAAGGMGGGRSGVAGRSAGGAAAGGAAMGSRSARAGAGTEFQGGAQGGMGQGGMRGGGASPGGMAGEVRGGAREIVDSIRGRGLAPLRGGQDSFREEFGEARQAFRQAGEEARNTFRDTRRDAREARAETRDETRDLEGRQEAWREAQETFRDASEEAREQFHDTFGDARQAFRDSRQEAASARDAFLNDRTRDRSTSPAPSAQRSSAPRDSDVSRDPTRSMRDILRQNADVSGTFGSTAQPSGGAFAADAQASGGAQATSSFRDPTRPLEEILEQNERVREEFRRTGRVPPLPREDPPLDGPVTPPGTPNRALGTSGFRDPTRPLEEILTENERIREEFRRTGRVPQLPSEPPVGRPVPPPQRPLPAGTHSRTVDPSQAGRDDSPVFQRLYEGLQGPFVPPPEQPTFVPGPGQGFPPPNVPPSTPTGQVPTSPTTPTVPAVPDSLTDLGLSLNAAALARGTLTVDQLSGPLADLGLNQGDTILAIDGQRITSANQLLNSLFSPQRYNTQTTIEVFRNGGFVEFSFVPSETFDDLF